VAAQRGLSICLRWRSARRSRSSSSTSRPPSARHDPTQGRHGRDELEDLRVAYLEVHRRLPRCVDRPARRYARNDQGALSNPAIYVPSSAASGGSAAILRPASRRAAVSRPVSPSVSSPRRRRARLSGLAIWEPPANAARGVAVLIVALAFMFVPGNDRVSAAPNSRLLSSSESNVRVCYLNDDTQEPP
jgi:hypothetical protein